MTKTATARVQRATQLRREARHRKREPAYERFDYERELRKARLPIHAKRIAADMRRLGKKAILGEHQCQK